MALPITPELAAQVFDAISERSLMTYLVLAMCTLARPGAIYDLRREQYDPEAGTVNMNPPGRRQTKKYRPNLLVPPSLKPWLNSVTDPKALYVTTSGSTMMSLNVSLKKVLKRADLPSNIAAYSFRHGLARWMRKLNVPAEQIDHYLGHLPRGAAKMTFIYAPFEAEHCQGACDAIENFVSEVRKKLKVNNIDDPESFEKAAAPNGRKANGYMSKERKEALIAAIKDGLGVTDAQRIFKVGCPTYYKYRYAIFGRPTRASRAKSVPKGSGAHES